jgi:hypothetical protein
MSVYNKCVRLKSIKIFGRCLWINRNVLYHFSFYLYSVQISNFATWSGLNFKTNVEVVLFKWENLTKTIWWLSVTSIAWGNHLGSLSYRQLVSMSCGMQLFHLVLHPPSSIDLCQTSKFIVFRNTSVVFLNISNKRHLISLHPKEHISFGKGVSIFMSCFNFLVLIPYFSV